MVRELHAQSFWAIPIKDAGRCPVVVFAYSEDVGKRFATVDQLETVSKRVNLISYIIERQKSREVEIEELIDYQQRMEFIQTLTDLDIVDLSRTILSRSIKIVPAAQAGWVGHLE